MNYQDRIASNSLKVRSELLSKMFICRLIIVWFILLYLVRNKFVYSKSFKIVVQFARYWSAFFTNNVRHVCDSYAILFWIRNWFKCKSMKTICVSIFKIEIEIIRNDLKMLRKQRFYMTANLLIIFDFLFLSMCQTKTS
jgi:hypothetical protein